MKQLFLTVLTFLCFCGCNEPQTHQISTDKVNTTVKPNAVC